MVSGISEHFCWALMISLGNVLYDEGYSNVLNDNLFHPYHRFGGDLMHEVNS